MNNVVEFYKTQVRILWEWQGGPWALIKRLLITLIVSAVAFWLTAWLLPNITVDRFLSGVAVVILMALLNAIVRPLILAFVAPRSLILTAISVLVMQILVFLIACNVVPGVTIGGFVPALFGSFIYAIINAALTGILGIDSGDSFYGSLIQRLLIKRGGAKSDKPALVIIQIDGLAHPILAGRMRAGSVNTLSSWVRDGTHKLSRWEAILPSMTSASQAGILHGNNDGIPAFRWFERDRQHLMVSSSPVDAGLMVSRISNGEGLLSNNGASITNLMSGDATRAYFTTSAIRNKSGQGLGESKAFLGFFLSPTGYLRSFTLFLAEFFKERIQARRTRRSGIQPQMHRGMKYAGMRAASNVLLRDVNVSLIIEEMYRGTNVIYADFTDYDELAHHCGPERVESFQALDGVDAAIGTLKKAAEDAPRPYKFIVLSDHGQSLGATFKQRYGKSLGEVVRDLMGGRATVVETTTAAEGSTFVNAFLSEITRSKGVGPSIARAALAGNTVDGVVDLDPVDIPPPAEEGSIAVVGSGNLGLVWFTGTDHRLTAEEIREKHPLLIAKLVEHPGVALVMVRSSEFGAMAMGRDGIRYLDQDRVEGVDPTTLFGEHTVMSLKREDAMTHVPDILLLSQYDPELGEVAAFEELIGSHGGLGGPQTQPFILHPSDWELDEPVPLGAPAIYRNIRRWLESIDIKLGRPTAASVEPEAVPAAAAAEAS